MKKYVSIFFLLLCASDSLAQFEGFRAIWRRSTTDSAYTEFALRLKDRVTFDADAFFNADLFVNLSSTEVTRFIAPGGDTLVIGVAGFSGTNSYAAGVLAEQHKDGATTFWARDTSGNASIGAVPTTYSQFGLGSTHVWMQPTSTLAQIETAIAAYTIINLPAGTWNAGNDTALVIKNKDKFILRGAGIGKTIITRTASGTEPIVWFSKCDSVIIEGITFDNGISKFDTLKYFEVRNNEFRDSPSSNGSVFTGCEYGSITGNVAKNNNQHGIELSGHNVTIADNNVVSNGVRGIELYQNTSHITISNNHLFDNYNGIYTYQADFISIVGNSTSADSAQGIQIEDSDHVVVVGNNINNKAVTGSQFGIAITTNSDSNFVFSNSIQSDTEIQNLSTTSVVQGRRSILLGNGSVSAPTYSFYERPSYEGMYLAGGDYKLAFAKDGISQLQLNTNSRIYLTSIVNQQSGFLNANAVGLLTFTDASSPVNNLNVANAAAGASPVISPIGSDANIGIALLPKGGGGVGIGTATSDRLFHPEVSDAVTNAVTYGMRLSHITSGLVAPSFGVGTEYELENARGVNELVATQEYVYTDTTNASEDVDFVLKLMAAGAAAAEKFRVSSTGGLSGVTTLSMNNQLTNTLAIGTAPFVVTSTTLNTNLNADLLDGSHASAFMASTLLKDLVTTVPLTGGVDDILPGADSDVTLAITVLKDLVAGVGLGGGADDILTGADADVTVNVLTDFDGGIEIVDDSLNIKINGTELATTSAGLAIASAITRDVEWDTEGEVQTAWGGANIILATEIDASSEILAIVGDETGTGALVFGTSPTITTSLAQDGDVADAGYLRLQNAAIIGWEASPAGTDVTLTVDASEIMQASGTFNAVALTEGAVGVPNVNDNLSVFAATTSLQLLGVLSDETGTGASVFAASPTLTGTISAQNITLADPGTSANSYTITLQADNATTVQSGTVQVLFGADPYMRLSAPADGGAATPVMDLKDQTIVLFNAAAGVDYSIQVNAETNDGIITFLEDEKTWQFDAGISLGDTVGFVLTAPGAATISSRNNVILDTFGGAVLDTAVTLTGVIGQVVHISSRNAARDIVFQDTGNFSLGALRTLSDPADVLVMKFTSATTLKEEFFADNN